jgi:hypothetical protein
MLLEVDGPAAKQKFPAIVLSHLATLLCPVTSLLFRIKSPGSTQRHGFRFHDKSSVVFLPENIIKRMF